MLFYDIEWLPASVCSIDSFDGSVEAVAGGGNSGDTGAGGPGGGYATSAADVAALGLVGAAGAIGGAPGALAGTFGLALTGTNPQQAAINVMHDMSLGLGNAVNTNPPISMYQTTADSGSVGTAYADNTLPVFAGSQ
jgi:hypothetical protein